MPPPVQDLTISLALLFSLFNVQYRFHDEMPFPVLLHARFLQVTDLVRALTAKRFVLFKKVRIVYESFLRFPPLHEGIQLCKFGRKRSRTFEHVPSTGRRLKHQMKTISHTIFLSRSTFALRARVQLSFSRASSSDGGRGVRRGR